MNYCTTAARVSALAGRASRRRDDHTKQTDGVFREGQVTAFISPTWWPAQDQEGEKSPIKRTQGAEVVRALTRFLSAVHISASTCSASTTYKVS